MLECLKDNSEIINIIYNYLGLIFTLGAIIAGIYTGINKCCNYYKKNKIKYIITAEWIPYKNSVYDRSFTKADIIEYYYVIKITNQSLNKDIVLDSLIATKPLKRKEYIYSLRIHPNIKLKYKEYYKVPIQRGVIQNISKRAQSKKIIFYFVDNFSNKKYKKKVKRKKLEEILKMI